jgi:hypothetical protein
MVGAPRATSDPLVHRPVTVAPARSRDGVVGGAGSPQGREVRQLELGVLRAYTGRVVI